MSGISPIYVMLIAWGAVTAVLVVLIIYRSLISMKEDDQLFLGAGEASLEQEQREVIARLQRLAPFMKGLSIASAALLAVMAVYEGVTQFHS
jgi:hypothetical protein